MVVDKIKEISDINEEDYIININQEEQTAEIIHQKTGVVVDIAVDSKGNITAEGSIVEDIVII